MAVKRKNPAAVALGRKGGKKGGFARAAKLSPAQRSESARKAVLARWARANHKPSNEAPAIKTSDNALLALLKRIKATDDPTEIKQLSDQLERVIFRFSTNRLAPPNRTPRVRIRLLAQDAEDQEAAPTEDFGSPD